jgi:hypothetical protein
LIEFILGKHTLGVRGKGKMLSRRFSFQKVIGHHERWTNASICHHFGQFSSSVGEPDRAISVAKSDSEDSSTSNSSSYAI